MSILFGLLHVGDVWQNDHFLRAFACVGENMHFVVLWRLVQTARVVCSSELMSVLAQHFVTVVGRQSDMQSLTRLCGVLFSLRRIEPATAALYCTTLRALYNTAPCMHNLYMGTNVHDAVSGYMHVEYRRARLFHVVLRELSATPRLQSSEETRKLCLSILNKSVCIVQSRMIMLLDFSNQHEDDKSALCHAVCNHVDLSTPECSYLVAVLCTLEALSNVFFSDRIMHTVFLLFLQGIRTDNSALVQFTQGVLMRILMYTHEVYMVRRYLLENNVLGQLLLVFHNASTTRDEGQIYAIVCVLHDAVRVTQLVDAVHLQQLVQVFSEAPGHTPLSTIALLVLLRLMMRWAQHTGLAPAWSWRELLVGDVAKICRLHRNPFVLVHAVLLLATLDKQARRRKASDVAGVLELCVQCVVLPGAPPSSKVVLLTCCTIFHELVTGPQVALACTHLRAMAQLLVAVFGEQHMLCIQERLRAAVLLCWLSERLHLLLPAHTDAVCDLYKAVAQTVRAVAAHLESTRMTFLDLTISALQGLQQLQGLEPEVLLELRAAASTLLNRVVCQRYSVTQMHRVSRLFKLVCPAQIDIRLLFGKNRLLIRLFECRLRDARSKTLVADMIQRLHTCNAGKCACTGFSEGMCRGVLQWCLWVLSNDTPHTVPYTKALAVLGTIVSCAARGTHKPLATRAVRLRLLGTLTQNPPQILRTCVPDLSVVHRL